MENFIGLLMIISGLVLGLGAVTVIDIHGFLGRKSSYWTIATTRTHKVTKPLIWLGIFLLNLGALIYFRGTLFSGVHLFIFVSSVALILNGLFLTFGVSSYLIKREKQGRDSELLPKAWQTKITLSFIVSFLGWWSIVFALAWCLTF